MYRDDWRLVLSCFLASAAGMALMFGSIMWMKEMLPRDLHWFVGGILVLGSGVAWFWLQHKIHRLLGGKEDEEWFG